jgi:hypothetical protein
MDLRFQGRRVWSLMGAGRDRGSENGDGIDLRGHDRPD